MEPGRGSVSRPRGWRWRRLAVVERAAVLGDRQEGVLPAPEAGARQHRVEEQPADLEAVDGFDDAGQLRRHRVPAAEVARPPDGRLLLRAPAFRQHALDLLAPALPAGLRRGALVVLSLDPVLSRDG
jgi:hypothetical protein